MSLDGYEHRYLEPEEGKPLIFAFHGTGGDENQFFDLARQLVPGAGVVSPRGDVSEMGAARFFRRTSEGVYDMADLAMRTRAMADFVEANKRQNPTAPIYGFGYSNGANILASVMMEAPELFERTALLHPLIPWRPEPVSALCGKSVLVTGGEHDPIGPIALTNALVAWLEEQGADVQTLFHGGGHELRPEEIDAVKRSFLVDHA